VCIFYIQYVLAILKKFLCKTVMNASLVILFQSINGRVLKEVMFLKEEGEKQLNS
jgi:hypothetical protein